MRYGIDESYWEEIKSVFSQFPKKKKPSCLVHGQKVTTNLFLMWTSRLWEKICRQQIF